MNYGDRLRAHLESHWGNPLRAIDWAEGRRHELPESFRVWVFRCRSGMLAYATIGMSDETDEAAIELFLLVREEDDDRTVAELLFMTAHFHRTSARLGLWHSVNFGKPWLDGSVCTRGFVSLPYLDGPGLERPAGMSTRILWLIPVTESEMAFRRELGVEELEQRFERSNFDYADPQRRAVV